MNIKVSLLKYLEIALSSRELFKNSFLAGLKYLIFYKLLKRQVSINVVCNDGSTLHLNPGVFGIIVNSYHDHRFIKFSCKERRVWITNDFSVSLSEFIRSGIYPALITKLGWRYDEGCRCWVKDNIKFKYARGANIEIFVYDEHKALDVSGRNVVDVGAFCGDTPIYFVLKGAKKVIAIEPCPDPYKEMLENLRLNGLLDKVIPVNAALGSKHGKSVIKCPSGMFKTDTITLKDVKDILDKLSISNAVLKMDCEGCEYDVILNQYEYITTFDEVYFEYHAYITGIPIVRLLENLSKDFKCMIVSDEDYYRRHGMNRKLLGLIKCVKRY